MPKSIYEEIFEDLKSKIETQEYKYETLLPSENDLTKIYNCSRNTLRRAISKLTSMGYTQPIHGRGVHIIYTKQKQKDCFYALNSLEGLHQAAKEQGSSVTNNVITFTEMVVDAHLAEKSGFEENTEVFFIQRLRSVDGVAKMIDNTLLRKDLVPNLTENTLKGSLFQYIEKEAGMTIQTVKRRVTIERTTPFDEKYLCLDGYNCLAVITSHVYNTDGIQFEFTISRNRPDLFVFDTVVSRNS
ncbi:MAG: GntR family transcriptional regulator [Eubacteriales bacterium]|nr:GntR family transcriptional regulator [Eubacteriales bacterium]